MNVGTAESPAVDPLAAFTSEPAADATKVSVTNTPATATDPRSGHAFWAVWLVCGLGLGFTVGELPAHLRAAAPPPAPTNGTVSINTTPAGLPVSIDGGDRGRTPIVVSLEPGTHLLRIAGPSAQKTTRLAIAAGQSSSTFFDFGANAPTSGRGKLSVTSDAPSRVSVDGSLVGTTPILVPDLAVGVHTIAVTAQGTTITWKAAIARGQAASAAVSFARPPTPGVAAGWMSVSAPFDVEVFDGQDLVGASGAKVMLAAGRHDLRFVNRALGYDQNRRVTLAAGKVSSITITAPKTSLDINARPWASVLIDGTDIGQTPLAKVPITIGTHVVVFRNPQLGEQRRTITATTAGPNRVAVDLTSK